MSSSNVLVDNGLASAGEFGVFGPEGTWLVEGHGVDPDIVVDNLPHATFMGEDTQLKAAVDHLLRASHHSFPLEPSDRLVGNFELSFDGDDFAADIVFEARRRPGEAFRRTETSRSTGLEGPGAAPTSASRLLSVEDRPVGRDAVAS